MIRQSRFASLSLFAILIFLDCASPLLGQGKPIKVFVLAGQSNMEGKGSVFTMERQLEDEAKKSRFEHFQKDGEFLQRDDVTISYLGNNGIRSGKLTIGYGTSRDGDKTLFGPELGFGWTVGNHFTEDVLIIKTAWGGKSIDCDFRPPSRGYPESIKQHFEKMKAKNPDASMEECQEQYGRFYRLMIEHVKTVLEESKSRDQAQNKYELAGFVWFQGFNDQFAPSSVEDYEDNMVAFIKDVRKDLGVQDLPFVIGAMGHQGKEQKGKVKLIADAQAAAARHADFNDGSVVTIRTADFWDYEAQEAFETYWNDEPNRDVEKWKTFGNDRAYHYFGSPKFFLDVGNAFGEAMIRMQGN